MSDDGVINLLPDRAGLYPDLPDVSYFRRQVSLGGVPVEVLSQSDGKWLLPPSTPAHFRAHMDDPKVVSSEAYDFGHAMHRLVTGRGAEVVVVPVTGWKTAAGKDAAEGWRTKEAIAAVDAVRAAGDIPLRPADWERGQQMLDALWRNGAARELLVMQLDAEVAMYGQDPETGVWLCGRIDALARTTALAIDYKTADMTAHRATPEEFTKTAWKLSYDVQDVWYRELAAALGRPIDDFWFIVQEKTPPYEAGVFQLNDDYRALAKAKRRQIIDLYAECLASGVWPGYPDEPQLVAPPAWAYRDVAVLTLEDEQTILEALE